MKYLALVYFSFLSFLSFAQNGSARRIDSVREIEPGKETSFENYELLIVAILGLLLLMGLRFWFKRTRKK